MSESAQSQSLSDAAERTAEASQSDSNRVGYCCPPKHAQFKPGQSGNPLGRSKQTDSFTSEIADELSQTIVVRDGSGDVRITKRRAIVKKMVAAAVAGDAKVASILIGLCTKLPRGQEEDPRAAADEAFVEKLGRA